MRNRSDTKSKIRWLIQDDFYPNQLQRSQDTYSAGHLDEQDRSPIIGLWNLATQKSVKRQQIVVIQPGDKHQQANWNNPQIS